MYMYMTLYGALRRGVPRTSLTLVARVLYGVVVWAPGRIGCLCNGLFAVLSSGIVFRASYSKMKLYRQWAPRRACMPRRTMSCFNSRQCHVSQSLHARYAPGPYNWCACTPGRAPGYTYALNKPALAPVQIRTAVRLRLY